MRIAICDDNKQELQIITNFFKDFSGSNYGETKFEIKSFSSSIELLSQLEDNCSFDLYLLDIIMPNIDGIQLAKEIRSKDKVAKIIFLTSTPEFAVDSYSVDAFYYLMKPIKKDKLFSLIEKACLDISNHRKQYIIVKSSTSLSKIFFNQLIYVEVQRRTLSFHQQDGATVESTSTISQIERILLKDKRFIKPHRSYIVNLDYIKELTQNNLITTSDRVIPVSRNLFKDVKNDYINYSFQND